jgi:hypothetical protein
VIGCFAGSNPNRATDQIQGVFMPALLLADHSQQVKRIGAGWLSVKDLQVHARSLS